jgi:hypothetical protein
MRKQSILLVAATVAISAGMALARDQTQTAQQFDKSGAGVQSTKRDKLPVVTLPETAPALHAGASLTGTTDQAATFEDRWPAQAGVPSLPPNATVPNLTAPLPETTGQAPNAPKKMGAEMESAGDQRASPDEH